MTERHLVVGDGSVPDNLMLGEVLRGEVAVPSDLAEPNESEGMVDAIISPETP